MHINLTGKTALVTGSTQGIGLAIAKGLASSGARVAINGRSDASVQRAIDNLASAVDGADLCRQYPPTSPPTSRWWRRCRLSFPPSTSW